MRTLQVKPKIFGNGKTLCKLKYEDENHITLKNGKLPKDLRTRAQRNDKGKTRKKTGKGQQIEFRLSESSHESENPTFNQYDLYPLRTAENADILATSSLYFTDEPVIQQNLFFPTVDNYRSNEFEGKYQNIMSLDLPSYMDSYNFFFNNKPSDNEWM